MTHTADLVERHRITLPVGATGDNVAVARLHAEAWAEWNGLEISAGSFEVLTTSYSSPGATARIGVAFDVVIGKGDINTDHRERGALDTWTWSARFQHWRRLLNGLGREGRRLAVREDGLAEVVRLGQYVSPPEGRQTSVEPYHGQVPPTAREQLGVPPEGDHGIRIKRGGIRMTDDAARLIENIPPEGARPVSVQGVTLDSEPVEPVDQRPPWLRRGEGWDEDDLND